MRVYQKVLSFMALVILFSHKIQASTCDSISQKLMEQTWKEFREIHPFGYQTVGFKHYGSDTCVFVMSEPAEWVKAEELEDLFVKNGGCFTIGRKAFGYDGGLYDGVGCIKLDTISFNDFTKKLFTLLYGTPYKAYYTDLDHPAQHVYFSETDFGIEPYIIHLGLSFATSPKATQEKISQIHFSQMRGGVLVWEFNPRQIFSSDSIFRENARRFLLDTDLILGAFCDKKMFIVGRERKIPVTVLPPLRTETIRLLASLESGAFSVSIQPDSDGFIEEGVWAKTLVMSEKLRDTELGNLLMLSDILLLSWSNRAFVHERFIEYPLPQWPMFDLGNTYHLDNVGQYTWKLSEVLDRIVWLNKTGSLKPCYYTANSSILDDSISNPYEVFSSLNNTDLTRVAQYAFIYKAFQIWKQKNGESIPSIKNASRDSWVQTPSTAILNTPMGTVSYQE